MGRHGGGDRGGDAVEDVKKDGGGNGGAVTVVLKLDLHCEGCAEKLRRWLNHLDGVQDVQTELSSNKLKVLGRVDPVGMKEMVEHKIKKKVELAASPKMEAVKEGGVEEKMPDNKSEKKNKVDDNEKKSKEPPVTTVVFSTRVHCDDCAQKIKRIVSKYEGVQDVSVDSQKDLITVKGAMNVKELLQYLNMKLKRTVEIVSAASKKDSADKKPKERGGDRKGVAQSARDVSKDARDNVSKVEVNKMEYYGTPYGYGAYTYDPSSSSSSSSNGYMMEHSHPSYHGQPGYGSYFLEPMHGPYPVEPHGNGYMGYHQAPDMFSDENPNACFIM
ncbi:Heavy metal-associated isoprenylated plant protein 6-like protein [Drosera capensis]